jgi:ketosteroid isomerase-like protein
MKKLLAFALIVATACAPGEPATPAHDPAADKAAIDAVRNAEMAGLNSGKTDWPATVYASDVHMMPPGEPAVSGVPGVTAWLEGMYKTAGVAGQYTSSQVEVTGDMAIDRYTAMLQLSPFNGGKRVNEIIKGIHIYKRQADGKWLIVQDVWNNDPMPANTK